MKPDVREDSTNLTKVAELLRFNTSKSGDEQISVEEDMDRMMEGQNDICCITGASITQVASALYLETIRKKGLEVLYVVDLVDEYGVQQLKEVDGKSSRARRRTVLTSRTRMRRRNWRG